MVKDKSQIVEVLAESVVDRIVKKCIRDLQKLDITLSGDPRLKTTWDEICVQLQNEYSFHWDDYVEAVLNYIIAEVEKLKEFEVLAIWFQTNSGFYFDEDEDDLVDKFDLYEIYHHIESEIYKRGGNWSNKGIRDYLENG